MYNEDVSSDLNYIFDYWNDLYIAFQFKKKTKKVLVDAQKNIVIEHLIVISLLIQGFT